MRIGVKKEYLEVNKLRNDLGDRRVERRIRMAGAVAPVISAAIVSAVAGYGIGVFQVPQVEVNRQKAIRDNDAKIIELYLSLPEKNRDDLKNLQMLIAMFDDESTVYPIFRSKMNVEESGGRMADGAGDCASFREESLKATAILDELKRSLAREVKGDGNTPSRWGPVAEAIRKQVVEQQALVTRWEADLKRRCPSSTGAASD